MSKKEEETGRVQCFDSEGEKFCKGGDGNKHMQCD